jgi:hypothetical protein
LIMLALPPIIILMDLVVFILLRKAKAIIWKFVKLETEKQHLNQDFLFLSSTLNIWDLHMLQISN